MDIIGIIGYIIALLVLIAIYLYVRRKWLVGYKKEIAIRRPYCDESGVCSHTAAKCVQGNSVWGCGDCSIPLMPKDK